MKEKTIGDILNPKKNADKEFYLSLLDDDRQTQYEEEHLRAVLLRLKAFYLLRIQSRIREIKQEIADIRARSDYGAADYRAVIEKKAEIEANEKKLKSFKCFFTEPYFARMDVTDDKEGYNSYYIGKKGDIHLEIVDWRAPLAVRYYQKSRVNFSINEFDYRTVLRRALSVKNGKLLGFKNEYLSVKDVLSPEEIAGRDEEILFDPYLRSIIQSRKDDSHIRDIIETIQEQQFDIITRPERESFVLQGCAGSGKTMILLHRLSYLMYNNEKLLPRDVLVITPSDSFNTFIDELSQVLELQKVKTVTLGDYFFQVLKNEHIDLRAKLTDEREPAEYLRYLYSDAFPADMKKRVKKIYGDLAGLFVSDECRAVAEEIKADCAKKRADYQRLKNASLRIRRAVLGEMKDNKEGGYYFTKPFRTLMSAYDQIEEFLAFVFSGKPHTPDRFFRQFAEFYKSAKHVSAAAEKVFANAVEDLRSLHAIVEREIADLKRYRQKFGDEVVYTYADRIARREELLAECDKFIHSVGGMSENTALFQEFFTVLRLSADARELGKCKEKADVVRWLYRATVKKVKKKYGMLGIYPSDGYALCLILNEAGRELTPRYGLVFIDEGQDISAGEYTLLARIHSDAAFNVFGDLKQNITPFRGLKSWDAVSDRVYLLDRNYRNTNEIVDFVMNVLDADMHPIGLHGEPVRTLDLKRLSEFFRSQQGLKAVIAREEYLPLFEKRGFARITKGLSKTKINVMTVYESKGLEFTAVAVYDRGMSENEKYISYTRALKELAVIREGEDE